MRSLALFGSTGSIGTQTLEQLDGTFRVDALCAATSWERLLEQVRHVGLLTDDEPRQHDFYTAMGFRNINSFEERLNAFVVFKP